MKKKDILKMGGVCALSLLLVTGCGEKKDDSTASSNKSNSNQIVDSNSNSNATEKKSESDALTTGRDLYKKAIATYPSPLSGALDSKCKLMNYDDEGRELYDCTNLYNELKTIYSENNAIFKEFTSKDGKQLYATGGIGFVGKTTTTLSIKSNSEDKIVFEASIDVYNEPDKSTTNYKDEFIIIKENGTWKISSYKYVLGASSTDEVK